MESTSDQRDNANANGANGLSGVAPWRETGADPPRIITALSEGPPTINSGTSAISPPYWSHSHVRSCSNVSVESIVPGVITLQDNTNGQSDKNEACWAKGAYIDDHVIINGSRTGIGAFVVWNITVETLSGGTIRIRKRYSEFEDLRCRLVQTFPHSEAAMPPLPPKGIISKFRSKFLEQRRIGLSYFLNCILLNPEFSGAPVLKEFLFD